MDDQLDRVSARRHELVAVASGMLAGDVNLIEGMRRICALRFAIEDPETNGKRTGIILDDRRREP